MMLNYPIGHQLSTISHQLSAISLDRPDKYRNAIDRVSILQDLRKTLDRTLYICRVGKILPTKERGVGAYLYYLTMLERRREFLSEDIKESDRTDP